MTPVATLWAAYDPDDIKPGWIALVVVVALAIATFLLWRSMNSQLRRIDVPTKAELAERGRADIDSSDSEGEGDRGDATDPDSDVTKDA